MGDEFRAVRAKVFGDAEDRQLANVRRGVEALAGDVPPERLAAKMGNTLSASNRLHKTYAPVALASVRDADAARKRGREKRPTESITAPAGRYRNTVQKNLSD